jgi:integrase/recombinase XerD
MSLSNASAATALVPADRAGDLLTSPIRTADKLAAAFLAGYGPATRAAYVRDLAAWARFLSEIGVEPLAVRRVHVEAYARALEEADFAPATIARRLSTLSGMYAYAVDEGLTDRSPLVRVRRPKRSDESPRRGLDRDEVRALMAAAEHSGDRDRALVSLLVLTGARISEVLGADVADLGRERGHRTLVVQRKGGKTQTIVLAPQTAEAVERMLSSRQLGPLFVTRSGRRLDRHAAAKTVGRLARVAGLGEGVSPHSLRHTFVTAALDAGAALHEVQDAVGHSDPRTTRRYDRRRGALDRSPVYAVASFLAA